MRHLDVVTCRPCGPTWTSDRASLTVKDPAVLNAIHIADDGAVTLGQSVQVVGTSGVQVNEQTMHLVQTGGTPYTGTVPMIQYGHGAVAFRARTPNPFPHDVHTVHT